MSILQDYESIRKSMGEERFKEVEVFLTKHPDLFLSDVYYKEEVWKQFETERGTFEKNALYYGFREIYHGGTSHTVSDSSIVGVQTDTTMKDLHKEFPYFSAEGQAVSAIRYDTYPTVEEAVSSVYCGPDSVEFRLDGIDKLRATVHMSDLDDNFNTKYRESLEQNGDSGTTEQHDAYKSIHEDARPFSVSNFFHEIR